MTWTFPVLILHVVICAGLIGLVLLQRSEGGALGMGGGSNSLMSGRGAADALARLTSIAGGLFLLTSVLLTVLTGVSKSGVDRSVLDTAPPPSIEQSAPAPAAPTEDTPPDPTQSALPEGAELASAATAQPVSQPVNQTVTAGPIAPAPTSAATRAGPLSNERPAAGSVQTASAQPPATRPAQTTAPHALPPATLRPQTGSTTTTSASRPASPPPATTTSAPRTSTQAPATRPANTQTAATTTQPPATNNGAALTVDPNTLTTPESGQDENPLGAVRRQRAGPDQ